MASPCKLDTPLKAKRSENALSKFGYNSSINDKQSERTSSSSSITLLISFFFSLLDSDWLKSVPINP